MPQARARAGPALARNRLRLGGFAKYATENYGVSVVGVTISAAQARTRGRALPGPAGRDPAAGLSRDQGSIRPRRLVRHVRACGPAELRHLLRIVHDCLTEDGIFLLETIGDNVSNSECNPWFQKYIFSAPTSMFPSIKEIAAAVENRFVVEDWHNFGGRLCTDAARLAREPRSAPGSDRHRIRRAALSDVGFLSPELRRVVRGAQLSELADRPCKRGIPAGFRQLRPVVT